VNVSPDDFLGILGRTEKPLVVHSEGGFFRTNYQYLTSYRGLAFHTKSNSPLLLPGDVELIVARHMWMPQ
jgi:hypothetical protein